MFALSMLVQMNGVIVACIGRLHDQGWKIAVVFPACLMYEPAL